MGLGCFAANRPTRNTFQSLIPPSVRTLSEERRSTCFIHCSEAPWRFGRINKRQRREALNAQFHVIGWAEDTETSSTEFCRGMVFTR